MKLSTHAPVHAVLAAITLLPGGVHAVGELCDEGDWGCGGGSGTTPYWSQTCAPSNCCCAQDPYFVLRAALALTLKVKQRVVDHAWENVHATMLGLM